MKIFIKTCKFFSVVVAFLLVAFYTGDIFAGSPATFNAFPAFNVLNANQSDYQWELDVTCKNNNASGSGSWKQDAIGEGFPFLAQFIEIIKEGCAMYPTLVIEKFNFFKADGGDMRNCDILANPISGRSAINILIDVNNKLCKVS